MGQTLLHYMKKPVGWLAAIVMMMAVIAAPAPALAASAPVPKPLVAKLTPVAHNNGTTDYSVSAHRRQFKGVDRYMLEITVRPDDGEPRTVTRSAKPNKGEALVNFTRPILRGLYTESVRVVVKAYRWADGKLVFVGKKTVHN